MSPPPASQSEVSLPSVIYRSAISTSETRALLKEALMRDIPIRVVDPATGLNLASGLALSTILTLVVIPAVYLLVPMRDEKAED